MAVERSTEKKKGYREQRQAILDKLSEGAAEDGEELKAMIEKFAKDVRRGMDENFL